MLYESLSEYLANPPNQVLGEALRSVVQAPDGSELSIHAGISAINSWTLFERVLEEQPELVIEIGMGYGVSTLTTLAALDAADAGRLISIDPYVGEFAKRRPVALALIDREGFGNRHHFENQPSWRAIPGLAEQGLRPEMIYIDGCHDLDCVFVDTFMSDQILTIGGVLSFNDAGWPSVHQVLKDLRESQRYQELDTGVGKSYRGRNLVYSVARRLQRRSDEDRYFRKLADRTTPAIVT